MVRDEIAAIDREQPPELVDRAGLARALGISTSTVDRLRRQGMPQIMICDAPRYRVAAVVQWLEARGQGLRIVGGGRP